MASGPPAPGTRIGATSRLPNSLIRQPSGLRARPASVSAQGDLKAWDTITNAEVLVMAKWVESRLPVVGVDEKEAHR